MTQQELQTRLKAIAVLMKTASPELMPRLQAEIDGLIGFTDGDEEYQQGVEALGMWESEQRSEDGS